MANKLEPIGKSSLGMDENLAALLSCVFGCITGVIFFLLEKDSKFVKFYALQSTIFFAATFVLGFVPIIGLFTGLLSFIVWIILLIKAYQGEWFELPIIGKIAMDQVNK